MAADHGLPTGLCAQHTDPPPSSHLVQMWNFCGVRGRPPSALETSPDGIGSRSLAAGPHVLTATVTTQPARVASLPSAPGKHHISNLPPGPPGPAWSPEPALSTYPGGSGGRSAARPGMCGVSGQLSERSGTAPNQVPAAPPGGRLCLSSGCSALSCGVSSPTKPAPSSRT